MSFSLSNFRAVMRAHQSVWWRTVRAWLRLFERILRNLFASFQPFSVENINANNSRDHHRCVQCN